LSYGPTFQRIASLRPQYRIAPLLQLRVLGFGLLVNRDVGVGVFPEGEEVFVGGEGADTGGVGIRA